MKLISLINPLADLLRYLGEPALRSLGLGCVAALVVSSTPPIASRRGKLRAFASGA